MVSKIEKFLVVLKGTDKTPTSVEGTTVCHDDTEDILVGLDAPTSEEELSAITVLAKESGLTEEQIKAVFG